MTNQSVCIIPKESLQCANLASSSLVAEAQKDYSSMRPLLSIHLFPKILIIRNQYPIFFKCPLDNLIVVYSARLLVHGKDIMPLSP